MALPENFCTSRGRAMQGKTSRISFSAAVFLSLTVSGHAEMQKLEEVAWWAAYGGFDADDRFKCALVTATPDGRDGKFVIEHWKDHDQLLLRFIKPSWMIEEGARKKLTLQFGYGRIWNLEAVGWKQEVRVNIPLSNADAFLSGFHSAGRIDVVFLGGTETSWQLATGGGGLIMPAFIKCIRMTGPAANPGPATQP
jgi:hypothetical protein